MTMIGEDHHPEPEALALFAEGGLEGEALRLIAEHLTGCEECREIVGETAAWITAERAPGSETHDGKAVRIWWWAAAAMLALVVTLVFYERAPGDLSERMVRLAQSQRELEPRLAGFPWAPLKRTRGSSDETDPARMKLVASATQIIEETSHDTTMRGRQARAVAQMLLGHPQNAWSDLNSIAPAERSASIWSDLAAASYAASGHGGGNAGLDEALTCADAALRLDARFEAALFNRALILDRMGRRDEAAAAWRQYLEVDHEGGWAREARERARRIAAPHATLEPSLPRAHGAGA